MEHKVSTIAFPHIYCDGENNAVCYEHASGKEAKKIVSELGVSLLK